MLLHFQAVDYEATVWVNGREAGRHRGGFAPFTCDLAGFAGPGETATIVVRARDEMREPKPSGKQSMSFANESCFYTRTTGIWQTVWMEPVPDTHLKRARITPDLAGRRFLIQQPLARNRGDCSVGARLFWQGREIASATASCAGDFAPALVLDILEGDLPLWGPGQPNLYDIEIELLGPGGAAIDKVRSYAGLRGVSLDGAAVKINGRTVFQRQVLDQGYYPDGIMTAPTDEALRRDIELAMAAGFNAARLHQKVFEERFLYHADRLGYLVWGEFGDWGMWGLDRRCAPYYHQPHAAAITQWLEALERDYSHPCIVGWCGANEQCEKIEDRMQSLDDLQRGMFLAAKAMDPARPVLDVSGHGHRVLKTDVYDSHDYARIITMRA